MKPSTRGLADRLRARSPGTARRTVEGAVGVLAAIRTIGTFRRTANPGEIEMVRQRDGSFAPADSTIDGVRATFREERDRARRMLIDADTRFRGAVPDALDGDDDDDDDGIPNAR